MEPVEGKPGEELEAVVEEQGAGDWRRVSKQRCEDGVENDGGFDVYVRGVVDVVVGLKRSGLGEFDAAVINTVVVEEEILGVGERAGHFKK